MYKTKDGLSIDDVAFWVESDDPRAANWRKVQAPGVVSDYKIELRQLRQQKAKEQSTAAWHEKHKEYIAEMDAAEQERQAVQEARLEALQEQERQRREGRVKQAARAQWVTNGGKIEDFDQQWPEQYQELLKTGKAAEMVSQQQRNIARAW